MSYNSHFCLWRWVTQRHDKKKPILTPQHNRRRRMRRYEPCRYFPSNELLPLLTPQKKLTPVCQKNMNFDLLSEIKLQILSWRFKIADTKAPSSFIFKVKSVYDLLLRFCLEISNRKEFDKMPNYMVYQSSYQTTFLDTHF